MRTWIETDSFPLDERFPRWREACLAPPMACELRCGDPARFSGRAQVGELGELSVLSVFSQTRYEFRRTPLLIRRHDSEQFRLALHTSGVGGLLTNDHEIPLHPGDMVLADTSHPIAGWRGAMADWVMITFRRGLMPLPSRYLESLAETPLRGGTGIGALVSGFIRSATADPDRFLPSDRARLGTAVLDVLSVLIAHELELGRLASPEAHRQALVLAVKEFIQRRLSDPDLSPATIAAAHHISIRQLQKLFAAHEETVGAWVRARRLEACRRELADPMLCDRPVGAIAARWGFVSAAHFSRVFKQAFAQSPREYRSERIGDSQH